MRQGNASGSPFCSQAARTVTGMWFVFWVFLGGFFLPPLLNIERFACKIKGLARVI